jgi:hypothetical protein
MNEIEIRILVERVRDLLRDPTQGYDTPLDMQRDLTASLAKEYIPKLCDVIETLLPKSRDEYVEIDIGCFERGCSCVSTNTFINDPEPTVRVVRAVPEAPATQNDRND